MPEKEQEAEVQRLVSALRAVADAKSLFEAVERIALPALTEFEHGRR